MRGSTRELIIDFLPGFIATESIEAVIKTATFISKLSQSSIKELLEELEKKSVEEANKKALDWLFGNDIRVASGNINTTYNDYQSRKVPGNFQYTMAYESLGGDRAEVVLRFYSSETLGYPEAKGSMGQSIGFLGDSPQRGELAPFIVTIKTQIERYGFGWRTISSPDTEIIVEFPDEVPRLALSEELPYPLEKQKARIQNTWAYIQRILGVLGDMGVKTAEELGNLTKNIGGFFGDMYGSLFQSSVADVVLETESGLLKTLSNEDKAENPLEEPAPVPLAQEPRQGQIEEEILPPLLFSQEKQDGAEAESTKETMPPEETEEPLAERILPQENEQAQQEKDPLTSEFSWCAPNDTSNPQQLTAIFSKIAWMGTGVSANDEWLELENSAFSSVDLDGWQLLDKDGDIQVLFGDIQVAPSGRFLLERTDDSSRPGIQADIIYTGGLRNTDEALYLFDDTCVLQDRVLANPNWPAGNNETKEVMARFPDLSWGPKKYALSGAGASSPSQKQEETPAQANEEPTICSQENLSPPLHSPIRLNEIAWMGTKNSSNDEWIELKNVSAEEATLEGWQLLDKDKHIEIVFSSQDHIPANGFFLLERTDDTAVSETNADKIYTGALSNTEESLRLFNEECILVDEVFAAPEWPAGTNEEKRTMERGEGLWWYTYEGEEKEGILGTPKKENEYKGSLEMEVSYSDTTPPEASFAALLKTHTSTDFTLSWSAHDPLGTVTPSGLDGFSILYTVTPERDGVFLSYWDEISWIDWLAGSAGALSLDSLTASVSVSGRDGFSYLFSLTAKDKAGNSSETETSIAIELAKSVVINEVAWMGTAASPNEEWIELFNSREETMSIAGWELRARDGTPSVQLTGSIPSQGYYVLERTDDTPISNQEAALTYTGALENTGETLELFDAGGVLLDSILMEEGWVKGNNEEKRTMERINPEKSGSDPENWETNILVVRNGEDSQGNPINGTPGKQNSVSFDITPVPYLDQALFKEREEVLLPTFASPYETKYGMNVPEDGILVLEPGVEIHFGSTASLDVAGTLLAIGTQEKNILLTATPGSWDGLKFTSSSSGSELHFARIEQAAHKGRPARYTSVSVRDSSVTFKNVEITSGGRNHRLYLENSDSLIEDSLLSGANYQSGSSASSAIYVAGGNPTIRGSTITDSNSGIQIEGAANPIIENNFFSGSTVAGIYSPAATEAVIKGNTFQDNYVAIRLSGRAQPEISGNTADGNTFNGIVMTSGINEDRTWKFQELPYIIESFSVDEGATLAIEPGVVVQFGKYSNSVGTRLVLSVMGALEANGTQEKPIIFTRVPSSTKWHWIQFFPESTGSILEHVKVEHGGAKVSIPGGTHVGPGAMLYVEESKLELFHTELSESVNAGLRFTSGAAISGTDVAFLNNKYGIHLPASEGACPALVNVTMQGNEENLYPPSASCLFPEE
ncbi:lamin tail domain-containing protein [Patescibacteria group bacterium]|nr:lamin tail domain-containing protein [Patescibacteria group bacterium]